MIDKEKIIIIRCEPFNESLEKLNYIPEGILCFQNEWYKKTNYYPIYLKYPENKEKIVELLSKDSYLVIIPMYQHSVYYSNELIENFRYNSKFYAAGPIALLDPTNIKKHIKVDGILGLEPVYSLLYDNKRIMFSNKIPENFYKKEYDLLPKINQKYMIDNKMLTIIPGSFLRCGKNCTFCINDTKKEFYKYYKVEDIIDRIPENEENLEIKFTYHNIFHDNNLDNFYKIIEKVYDRTSKIFLWTDPLSFLENYNKIKIKDKIIFWNIGFESFSNFQLSRYNNLLYKNKKNNEECIEIINNISNYRVSPLLMIFDPWLTSEELIETIEGYSKIKKNKLICADGSIVWSSITNNMWNPYPNTKLFYRAKKENLLNLQNFNEFDYPYYFDKINYHDWPWKFKYEKTKNIYFNLLSWSNKIKQQKIKYIRKGLSKCNICSGGFTITDKAIKNGRFLFSDLEKKLISYLQDKITKQEIDSEIDKIINHVNILNNFLEPE